MSEIKMINGQSLPNIPWQERPADLEEGAVLWRYTENPVMGRNPTPKIGRIFNSAVVPWQRARAVRGRKRRAVDA